MNPDAAARLHSRYQPQAEADRYIASLNLPPDIDYCILIEPGLGYLLHALRKIRPECTPVVLHADSSFRSTDTCNDAVWYPECGLQVQAFLENTIPDTASIHIIEWRPSLNVYPDACLSLVRECVQFIKRAGASRRTASAFGRRWVRNFFRNLMLIRTVIVYRVLDMPVVITGSGPSLESVMPLIANGRQGIFLIAASSSLPALASGGIIPDMVICTDGGAWALLHLHACFRKSPSLPMMASSLSAALPSQCSELPLLPLNDGSLWQTMALHAAGIPSVIIPQRGTVAASALELAFELSSGSIFLAGMDLALNDIQTHARPHGFDHLFSGQATRIQPLYSQLFMRAWDMRAGGSHDVYAAWFKDRLDTHSKRIFSLGKNHAALGDTLTGIPQVKDRTGNGCFKIITLDNNSNRRNRAVQALSGALEDSAYAEELTQELAPLLFPLRKDVSAGEIVQVLKELN